MKQSFVSMVAKATIFISILIMLLMSVAVADNYYIATTGNDSNNGSLSSPWRTVKHAWRNCGGGDTVYVRGGTYPEGEMWLRGGGGSNKQFWTLKAYPGETPIFTNARFIADDDYIRIQGLHLTSSSFAQAVSWNGIHEHIEILDNVFTGASPALYYICNNGLVQGNTVNLTNADSHGLYIMHGSNNIVRNNYVKGALKYGIQIYDEEKYSSEGKVSIKNLLVENNTVVGSLGFVISGGDGSKQPIDIDGVVIRNNVTINNAANGIRIAFRGHIRNVDIFNNVIYGNERSGINITASDVDDITIKNNIFSSNKRAHIEVSSSLNNLVVSHNLYYQPESAGTGVTDDSPVFGNPLFVNADEGDFHLKEGSPAIDAGVEVGIPYSGTAPDLGAFEYGESSAVESTKKLPRRFNLQQNYPNPFNPETEICYFLPRIVDVDLSIFDVSGKHVITLVTERQHAGNRAVCWNGRDENNDAVSSGIYFYRLTTNSYSVTKKMSLVR